MCDELDEGVEVKVQIIRSGKKIYEVAQKLGWHPCKISGIISGTYRPSWTEKKQLAEAIGKSVGEVFPSPVYPQKKVMGT